MTRRAALGLAAALAGPAALSGCLFDRGWFRSDPLAGSDTQQPPTVSPAYLRASHRVHELGRQILDHNPFCGVEPLFFVAGFPEPAVFHSGTSQLVVSEGLVNACKTEAELAAVICSELGRMMAEQRAAGTAPAATTAGEPDTFLPDARPTGNKSSDALPHVRPPDVRDPAVLARDLLRGAGYDPAELDRAAPRLKPSARGDALRKQMAGSAAPPTWDR